MWWFFVTSLTPLSGRRSPPCPWAPPGIPAETGANPLVSSSHDELDAYFCIFYNNLKSNELLLRKKVESCYRAFLIDLFQNWIVNFNTWIGIGIRIQQLI
jgi:hypothetical protein